ncbi:hypothetical protein N8E87_03805 [Avibacterium paragallinarum]|nr:hypothetical protein [Avibacterium paragallinarum]UXN38145.1 hypothetical protein N8E87_03805 [Avibacterium paragallinarum]
MKPMTKEEIIEQQRQLHILFKAWMEDKKKRKILIICNFVR